ncbi:MAG TPA: ACP phosphodiesterase [Verrucomicrobiae bacterium]|nr:ACP phosphodiesterase [Verrucomicrobiae bacterium]
MNWLSHLYLSEPAAEFRIGNLLPDLAPLSALADLPPAFQRGAEQHRRIDAFTDAHPVVRRSIQRIQPPYRRFGGILVDIFYDHFLTREWDSLHPQPLPDFVAEVYASFDDHRESIPQAAHFPLEQMKAHDWLSSYGDLDGIALTLQRVAARFQRPVPIGDGAHILRDHYDAFQSDFATFFPDLCAHVGLEPAKITLAGLKSASKT